MGPELAAAYAKIRDRVLATKWVFVALVTTCSIWWTLSWLVGELRHWNRLPRARPGAGGGRSGAFFPVEAWISCLAIVGWVLWIASLAEAVAVIVILGITRNVVEGLPLPEGDTTISYGSLFFACLVILAVILGFAIREVSHEIPAPERQVKVPYDGMETGVSIICSAS